MPKSRVRRRLLAGLVLTGVLAGASGGLPVVILAGSQRCGTTALFNDLCRALAVEGPTGASSSAPDDLCRARAKEVHFFDKEGQLCDPRFNAAATLTSLCFDDDNRTVAWARLARFEYAKLVPAPAEIDATPRYMRVDAVPSRVRRVFGLAAGGTPRRLPAVAFVLRRPEERTWSWFNFIVTRSFIAARQHLRVSLEQDLFERWIGMVTHAGRRRADVFHLYVVDRLSIARACAKSAEPLSGWACAARFPDLHAQDDGIVGSLYARQLQPWVQELGAASLFVVAFRCYFDGPGKRGLLAALSQRLGVPPMGMSSAPGPARANTYAEILAKADAGTKSNATALPSSGMRPDTFERLREFFAPPTKVLEDSLAKWGVYRGADVCPGPFSSWW